MQIVIDIPDAPINDYRNLYYMIHCMAASEGLFDDKVKSQRVLALKVVLNVLEGVVEGIPLPKGHGRLIDADNLYENTEICHSDIDGYACVRWKDINDAPTIIEAESEDKE